MSSNYSSLCRAQLTFEYLHTNSTTHEFLFGALAELVDNSRKQYWVMLFLVLIPSTVLDFMRLSIHRDAGATKMHIYTVPNEKYRGRFLLNFLDDGCGMDPVELSQVIQFGRSMKRHSGSNQIGQYGNGLKSGSMRIGKDMILFTKKRNTMSCLFLSRTFHEQEGIEEVIVPMPSWNLETKEPLVNGADELERHEIEMDIILKHSPFTSIYALFDKMNEIDGAAGTLVVIYNLKILDSGEPELDFLTNEYDILMKDPHAGEEYGFDEYINPEKSSFRSYVSVLYSEPRMRVFIQKKKVRTKKLMNNLYKPISYTYTSNRFRTRSEKEVEKAEREAKIAEEKAKELSLQAKEAMPRDNVSAKNSRIESQSRQMKAEQARIDAQVKRRIADEKKKSLKEPKQLTFTFGFNTDMRKCDGMFIYNCNRLIRMCEKIGPQLEGGVKCSGIVGVVDVPYLVLEPTHNKQDFADAKEYKHLLRSMAEHMIQYWKDSKIEDHGVTSFWEQFGYTGRWKDDPSSDQKFVLKRTMNVPLCVQCDTCLKWRTLQFSRKLTRDNVPDDWVCANNTDNNFKSCSKPEQKPNIPIGKLQKEIKSVELRAEQDIEKLQEKLEKAKKIANRAKPSRSRVQQPPPPPAKISSAPPTPRNITREKESRPKTVEKAYQDIRPTGMKSRRSEQAPSNVRKVEPKIETPLSPPAKKRAPSAATPSPRLPRKQEKPKQTRELVKVKRQPVESSHEEDESISLAATKRKKVAEDHSVENENITPSSTADDKEIEKKKEEDHLETVYKIGIRVEANINRRWYAGKVIKHQLKPLTHALSIKVKFDLHYQDKFDKWFLDSDPNLRLLQDEPAVPEPPKASSPSNNEISSSIASPSAATDESTSELLNGVCNIFRKCLHYFRPPDFAIDRNDILHNLTPNELKDFPLADFIKDYERNIKRLVGEQENMQRRLEEEVEQELKPIKAEIAAKDLKLSKLEKSLAATESEQKKLRLNVNVMIRQIRQGDSEIDSADCSKRVDTLLEQIVNEIGDAESNIVSNESDLEIIS